MRATVWFENGAVARHGRERGPVFFDAYRADDPVLRAQQRLPPASVARPPAFSRARQGKQAQSDRR